MPAGPVPCGAETMAVGGEPRLRKVVNGYGDGGFRIAGERVEGSVIVFPERFLSWPVDTMAALDLASLAPVVAAADKVDILLLGSGDTAPAVSSDLRAALRDLGIAVDAMSTGAACRTYNILLTESRAVAAALIAV